MLLYEVALGKPHEGELIVKELPQGCDSVICRGSLFQDFSQQIKTEDGAVIPMVKATITGPLSVVPFNKYFIYKKNQVHIPLSILTV